MGTVGVGLSPGPVSDDAPATPDVPPGLLTTRYLVTCEHGGKLVAPRYQPLFAGHEEVLASHRGYDPGALVLARQMASALDAPLVASTTSRLVVDLNRSIGHPRLHSQPIREAPPDLRREILARYYHGYRGRAERLIEEALARGERVIHISSHSFTPVLGQQVRHADIGLLYDPARAGERRLCEHWRAVLARHAPGMVVRRNYPYTGKSDGFCTHLRRRFPADRYVGVELEMNQKHVFRGGRHWQGLRRAVVIALLEAVEGWHHAY
jgi:predicted N-formylglutamate amidohydrolase